MPIDPRISLGVQPLQIADPLAQYGQVQNILASQAQQRSAGTQQQAAELQLQQAQRQIQQDEEYVTKMAEAIGKNGGPSDMMQAARVMSGNRNPQVSATGIQMLQSLQRLDAAKKAGVYGAPAPAMPSVAPAPGALGSGTFDPNAPVSAPMPTQAQRFAGSMGTNLPPVGAANQLAPAPVTPVNQLVDNTAALRAEYTRLSEFSDLPGVKDRMDLIKEQLKETGKLYTVGGNLVTSTGKSVFTAPPTETELQKNFDFAKTPEGGNYKGSFADFKAISTPKTSITTKQEGAFATGLGKGQSERILANQVVAQDAAAILETNQVGRELLKSGAITGTGADFFVGFNNALKQAGIDFGYADAAANSQAYAAAMGANVGRIIKQFGAGTGLSDADREYAAQMAGGKISLTEASLRKILDINDRAANRVIDLHNKNVSGIKTNIPLTVDKPAFTQQKSAVDQIPGQSRAAPAATTIPQAAVDALKAGRGTDAEFDAIFGSGAAKRARGGK
jgi:hypothetical protein